MKKYTLILVLFLSATAFAFSTTQANNTSLLFDKAGKLYQKGEYAIAVGQYEKILQSGFESPDVYYNLGNCYFKTNDIAKSILNFERAKRLSPDDEDINFNLKIANMKTIDKIEPVPQFFFFEWFGSMREWLSSGAWAVVVVVFAWLGFVLLAAFFISWSGLVKRLTFFVAIASFLVTILSFIFAYQMNSKEQERTNAIVFNPSVYVKSSPDDKGTDLFILHEGTKVRILDEVSNWQKIRLLNGNVGWLKKSEIEII